MPHLEPMVELEKPPAEQLKVKQLFCLVLNISCLVLCLLDA